MMSSQMDSEPVGLVEGARRAAKCTQIRKECTRVGGQPKILS